jgi:UDP-hydrolysing UDP-N-acetyl-D-glucosamine 2-epimerase
VTLKIGAATTSRADYGSLLPVLRCIQSDPELSLVLLVGGSHFAPGNTVQAIEADAFPIAARIESQLASDAPRDVALSAGQGLMDFAEALAEHQPDILLISGDRYEMLAVAAAATALRVPLAHISGGEVTEGALDDGIRHALTKLSHLHFVANEDSAQRVQQMGEESWRVHVTGDPGLDFLRDISLLSREELAQDLGIPLHSPLVSVTFHPATISPTPLEEQITALLDALADFDGTLVISAPNTDTGSAIIRQKWAVFCGQHPYALMVHSLGQRRYYSLLSHADAMIGNSSSGIWEAPSFRLPVVNVGERQGGRLRAANVLDVGYDPAAIRATLQTALTPSFQASLAALVNPYGDGMAAPRIVNHLKSAAYPELLFKKFVDIRQGEMS